MHGDTHSFIVRIWHEAVDKKGRITVWRGSIEHVGDGKRLSFSDLNGLLRFIREQAGLPLRRSYSWWKSLLAWIRRDGI